VCSWPGYFHGAFDIRMIWLGGLSELLGGGLPVRNALLYTYIAEGKAGALYAGLCSYYSYYLPYSC